MFTTDSRTEMFLTSIGVEYKYESGIVFPSDFATGWNTENIGRPVAVRENAVIEYASLMEAGSAAPAPIIVSTASGFRVLDGVQRLTAAELNHTTRVSAYVVKTSSDDILAMIRVLANPRMQGCAESPEWTRRRAIEVLVIDRGMSTEEVARNGGWKHADVVRIADAIKLNAKMSNYGAPDLSDAMLAELSPHVGVAIEQASAPVVGFLQTLKKSKISAADAKPYIEEFFAPVAKSEKAFSAYESRLEIFQDDAEIRTRITGRQSVEIAKDVVLLRALKTASTVIDEISMAGAKVHNVDEFFRLLAKITKNLKAISPNKQPQAARVPSDMWSTK